MRPTTAIAILLLAGCRTSVNESASEPAAPVASNLPAARQALSLHDVVQRDTMVFTPPQPPGALVEAMAAHRVAVLGELHLLAQHHDFVMATLEALQARGTRLLLLESFHAHSHRTDRFVLGHTDTLSPATERFFGYLLRKIRHLNEGLEPDQRVHVALVDINHAAWALPGAIALDLAEHGGAGPRRDFLSAIGWDPTKPYEAQRAGFAKAWQLDPKSLSDALAALRSQLDPAADAWLAEAADVAAQSLAVKKVWAEQGEHVAHPQREEVIKRLVDGHLSGAEATVLISIGGYHAQRRHVMGTPKRWLAEHLADPRGPNGGSVYSVYVNVAQAEQLAGSEVRTLSIGDDPDELMWQLADVAGELAAYLPLTDPVFAREAVPVHYLYNVVKHRPAEQFDAFVLLAHGTLLPGFAAG